MCKQAGSIIVGLQNQFRDKVSENVQRFLARVDKRRLAESTMGQASTNLIMSMNRAGNWYASNLEKAIRKELKEESAERKKSRAPRAPNPALSRKYLLSDNMSSFMGEPSATRQDVLKRVWEYVKERNLKDINQPGRVRVDDNLNRILGSGDSNGLVRNTEIMGLISKHFIKPE